MMCEREETRTEELQKVLTLADSWKKKGDELLFSMIPKPVADRLKNGLDPSKTCQNFDEVTVIFAEFYEESGYRRTTAAMCTVSTLNVSTDECTK